MTRGFGHGMRAHVVATTTLLGAAACSRHPETTLTDRTVVAQSPLSGAAVALIGSCNAAEAARSPTLIPEAALVDPDARVRRAATRALARTLDGRASDGKETERLDKGLSDGDPEVVAWAAYGLGASCTNHEAETVRALVARAASLAGSRGPATLDTARFALSSEGAIADALARCGTLLAEQTLRAWLEGVHERGESAALSLSRLAGKRRYLDDATTVALLDAASRPTPLTGALAAFARLDALPAPVAQRLVDVAVRVLGHSGAARPFAIRALGSAGAAAASPLADVLANPHAVPEERSLAATALGRLGAEGTAALSRALGAMVDGPQVADEHFLATNYAPLSATLAALTPPVTSAAKALGTLAALPIPDAATPELRRRLVALRCGAGSILAGTASQSARLVQCDPDPEGRAGALATLRVLDRGSLTAARFDRWKALAESADPAPRRGALALIPKHPEMPVVIDLLVTALGAKEPGVVAEAARVLAASPGRGAARPAGDAPDDPKTLAAPALPIVEALAKALEAVRPPDQVETRVALVRAASRLGVLSLKPRVERLCTSDNVTVRHAAEEAMRAMGSQDAHCNAPKLAGPQATTTPTAAAVGQLTMTFVTDAGRLGLTLDATLAPLAVSRLTELAQSGFYDGLAIQRVSPGFLVQFGDPVGDGYGGAGKPPLPSETSPLELPALSVGLAESGRDTGSSQIFVTLSPEPALYGDYPLLGWADPEWATAAEGDIIRSVEVKR